MNRYCTAVILIIVILSLIAVIPPAVRAMDNVDKNTKNTCRTIDDASSQAYTYIYANGLDQHAVEMYRHNLDLCVDAIKDNPDNYGLMWRYARAASEYCECVQALRATYPGWKKIMQTWGLKGAQMATQAQAVEPGRVEAYYWRTCCTGKYTMADGIGSMLTAIRQGALPKTRQDIIKAYELDPAYLDWITTYAYFQFLTHLPSIPFMVKGTKASRFKEALTYYEQYHAGVKSGYQQIYGWDIRAAYTAEALVEAVDVMGMKGEKRQEYLGRAEEQCKVGMESPRAFYRERCREILARIEGMEQLRVWNNRHN